MAGADYSSKICEICGVVFTRPPKRSHDQWHHTRTCGSEKCLKEVRRQSGRMGGFSKAQACKQRRHQKQQPQAAKPPTASGPVFVRLPDDEHGAVLAAYRKMRGIQ